MFHFIYVFIILELVLKTFFFFLRAGLQGFNYSLARVLCILNSERPQNSHEMNSNLRVCTAVRLRCRVQVVCEV